ncbi:hypothetical protein [Variovorax sp. 770b2]|uniref:hypothetical protein n=1 Tax=Variovorax sp. 770b2 TaxID=1566271 RepID=UPI001160346F|nr:hypothetical protein [Variovorax sp. 770b2]
MSTILSQVAKALANPQPVELGADLPEVMLTNEVAEFLRMSPESLTNMYYKRKKWLPPRRKLGGVYRYLKRDVIACVAPTPQER